MKWTRQRCQVAPCRTLAVAAFKPSCASEITRATSLNPRRTSERRNTVQKAWSSLGPTSTPRTWRHPSAVTPTATTVAIEVTRPASRTLW